MLLDTELVQCDVMSFLLLDVFPDGGLVQPDGRDVVALGPELTVTELVLQARVFVEYHQRILPLEIAHHTRYAVLRRYRHQHVYMVEHQVPLNYLDALVLAKPSQDLANVIPDLVVDDFAPILRHEHDVALTHPFHVRQAVGILGHSHHLSDSDFDGLNNRQYPSGGWFCKADCHPPA